MMPSTWVISYVSSQWWISHWPELQISVNQTRTCQVQLHPGKLTFPFCCYCNTMLLASPLTRGLLALFKTYFQGHKRTFNDLIWDDDVEYFAGQNVTQKGRNNISIQTLFRNCLCFTFRMSETTRKSWRHVCMHFWTLEEVKKVGKLNSFWQVTNCTHLSPSS